VPLLGSTPQRDPLRCGLVHGHVSLVEREGFDADLQDGAAAAQGLSETAHGWRQRLWHIELCGEAVTPEHNQSYGFGWAVGEGCDVALTLVRAWDVVIGPDASVNNDPRVTFEQVCTEPAKDGEILDTSTTVFRITLPDTAYSIDGKSVSFSLHRADLPAPAAALLEPGTTWLTPYAGGRYLPASGLGSVFFTDAQGSADVRSSDGADYAGTVQTFVVQD
jgi:hypothetical protein